MCQKLDCKCPVRCALCGKFLSFKKPVKDVSVTYAYDYEPAEFKWAHKVCPK